MKDSEKEKLIEELISANKELALRNEENEKRIAELYVSGDELIKLYKANDSLKTQLEQKIIFQNKLLDDVYKNISDYKFALDESSLVTITDVKGIIVHVNDNFCEISKYNTDELVGQDHRLVNSGYHSKEFMRNLWSTITQGNVWKGEIKNKAKDGSYFWVETTIVPFIDDNGKIFKYLAVRANITPRKIANEKILMLNNELEAKVKERTLKLTESLEREKHLNAIKSSFVSLVSHEFRTPLASILSSASIIEMYPKTEQQENRLKHINQICSAVKNLDDILSDFLSLGELEKGKIKVESTTFNLAVFLGSLIEEFDGILKIKNQKIKCFYKGEQLIDQSEKIIKNILLNLLSNASKYSENDSEIRVNTVVDKNHVTISVKDSGIGIPEDDQNKIFNQFFRAGNVGNIQGTGLGLNIVQQYLELINGKVTFLSTVEEQGTTFTVEFPSFKR
ncbi:MAG: PAS domain-containing sensor histidine kinase [Bacteroidota bacterium]|nr:PAS domain-containing sensor histidine kinase [Bacteroidota bacterium]MDP3144921.1 PAS domain-containing sensor histidine kinase [Bacteroidota bacterium]